jgi:hypothetical protein
VTRVSVNAEAWYRTIAAAVAAGTSVATTQLTEIYPVQSFTKSVSAMASNLAPFQAPIARRNELLTACPARSNGGGNSGDNSNASPTGSGGGDGGGGNPGGNNNPATTAPPPETTANAGGSEPEPTSTQPSNPAPTGMQIEFFGQDNCEGRGEFGPARGVCDVFVFPYRSFRITNAPKSRCQIALFDRGYCNGGNLADGNDLAFFVPYAAGSEGEFERFSSDRFPGMGSYMVPYADAKSQDNACAFGIIASLRLCRLSIVEYLRSAWLRLASSGCSWPV